jgi:hypothetical protein
MAARDLRLLRQTIEVSEGVAVVKTSPLSVPLDAAVGGLAESLAELLSRTMRPGAR